MRDFVCTKANDVAIFASTRLSQPRQTQKMRTTVDGFSSDQDLTNSTENFKRKNWSKTD